MDSSLQREKISAGVELKFSAWGVTSVPTGFIEIPCRVITLNTLSVITEEDKSDPVTLSGLAPANQKGSPSSLPA